MKEVIEMVKEHKDGVQGMMIVLGYGVVIYAFGLLFGTY